MVDNDLRAEEPSPLTTPPGSGPSLPLSAPSARAWHPIESRAPSCDGTDRHLLGISPRARIIFVGVTVGLLALVVAIGQFDHLGVYAVGFLIGALLAAGFSLTLDGGDLVANRLGAKKIVPLSSVVRAERYSYRGSVSLRLWSQGGKRAPSIPVAARFFRLDPVAAGHVRKYLDRPDVTWGPGAWEALAGACGLPEAAGSPGWPSAISAEESHPKGVEVPAKPRSRWARVGVWFTLAAIGIGALVLVIVAPVTWSQYLESQRIQHGPETSAVLRQEWISSYSDRYGTHHTTHFMVAFDTANQQLVTTQIDAPGSWTTEPVGARFAIRYDPSSPQHAELPGAPAHSLGTAVTTTVIGALCLVFFALLLYATWFARKRRTARLLAGSDR